MHLVSWQSDSDSSYDYQARDVDKGELLSSEKDGAYTEDEYVISRSNPTKKARLRSLKDKAKEKTKRLLSIDDAQIQDGEVDIAENIKSDPAFNPGFLRDKQQKKEREGGASPAANLSAVVTSIVSPKDAIKGKATRTTAGKLSKVQRPYLSKDADLEFLEAHNQLDRAESSRSSMQATTDDDNNSLVEGHKGRIDEMKAHRESLRVAWTTTRFVTRVRVVPKRHLDFPARKVFVKNAQEQSAWARYDWLKWMGHVLVWYTQDFSAQYIDEFETLPYEIDSVRRHVERIIFASAPWQAWLMDVRSVYRWEQPYTTLKWFVLYVILWYTNHLIGFLYAYILYIVLKSRYYPTSVDSLRTSMQRAHDRHQSAYRISELIDKHGSENWIEPLMQEIGPYVQLQLGDIANMLEVFSNFYQWMYPRKTAATLWFFASCLLITLFCDMGYCVKITGFVVGGTFFLCWPIASIHPKYRYLVSPIKWVLWDIPTDAEWSFQHLRRRAQDNREQIISQSVQESYDHETAHPYLVNYTDQIATVPELPIRVTQLANTDEDDQDDGASWHSADSSCSVLDSRETVAFKARSDNTTGRFIVYTNGVRFVRSWKKKELWQRTFLELAEMRKLDGSTLSRLTLKALEQLELTFTDGSSVVLEAMKDRDEAFNTIIGFSALQWQSLQYRPGESGQSRGHRQ